MERASESSWLSRTLLRGRADAEELGAEVMSGAHCLSMQSSFSQVGRVLSGTRDPALTCHKTGRRLLTLRVYIHS